MTDFLLAGEFDNREGGFAQCGVLESVREGWLSIRRSARLARIRLLRYEATETKFRGFSLMYQAVFECGLLGAQQRMRNELNKLVVMDNDFLAVEEEL